MNNLTYTPLLSTTDWNEEWKRFQKMRKHGDDAAIWDAKAKTFPVKHGSQEGYVQQFLQLAGIKPGETVFDMGCGTGALATPLAQDGHKVIACDFSRGMLDVMLQDQRDLGISGVETHVMSWDDNWNNHHIEDGCAHVAVASRSIATYDLENALMKLNDVASRRVCITLPASLSPKCDDELLQAAGFEPSIGRDFLYAFLILATKGFSPEVSYIPNSRLEVFDSKEDAIQTFSGIVQTAVTGIASEQQMAAIEPRITQWLNDRLVHDEKGFHLAQPRLVTWAFIAWDKPAA